MEVLWRNHGGKKTYIFSTSMFERRMQMWQCLRMKELHFGTKDLTTSTWRALRVRLIPHNKTVLRNVPIEPSWNVQEA
jgi:hypothetical protein